MSNPNKPSPLFVAAFSATVSGAINTLLNSPFSRIQYILQAQSEIYNSGRLKTPYSNCINCTKRILEKEGFLSLWKGSHLSFLRVFPSITLNFIMKDTIKTYFKYNKKDHYLLNLTRNITAGTLAGGLSLCVLYPIDYARIRLATDIISSSEKRQFKNTMDVFNESITSDGIRGVYRGIGVSIVGIAAYRGLYFGLYDTIKPFCNNSSITAQIILGYSVTVISGICTYPLSTIQVRMLMRTCESQKYNNSLHCLQSILAKENITVLFRGLEIVFIRSIAGATILAGYDFIKSFF